MFESGADIVYHAAGGPVAGLFQAAREYSEANDTKVWAIGVDSDQYLTAGADVQDYILTSMLKRVDVAVYNTIEAHVNGEFTAGPRRLRPVGRRCRLLDVRRVHRRHRRPARGLQAADHRRGHRRPTTP
jgi:basic membrane lipoprotein Med (substrate-binding protein (PBP1-ABC) superfamily)